MTPPQADGEEIIPPDEDEILAILRECGDRRTGPRWVAGIATGVRQGEALGLLWPHVDLRHDGAESIAVEWELARLPWQHGCEDPHACGGRLHRYPCPKDCPKAARVSGRCHTCVKASDPGLCPAGCTGHARSCPERAEGGLRLKRPKSAKSRRTIPLAPYASAVLKQWRTTQKTERLAHPAWRGWAHDPASCPQRLRPKQYVCPACHLPAEPGLAVFAQADGTPTDPRADWQDWADLLADAGVGRYRVHDGRHAFATALLEEGMDIRIVQEIMGHASPDFTRRAYQHVRPKARQAAAGVIDRRLRGGG